MSKGSRQRPTDKKVFDVNWDNIFSKKGKTSLQDTMDDLSPEQRNEYLKGVFTPTGEVNKDEDKH